MASSSETIEMPTPSTTSPPHPTVTAPSPSTSASVATTAPTVFRSPTAGTTSSGSTAPASKSSTAPGRSPPSNQPDGVVVFPVEAGLPRGGRSDAETCHLHPRHGRVRLSPSGRRLLRQHVHVLDHVDSGLNSGD